MSAPPRTLLVGASGYVGGLLRRELHRRGEAFRSLARDPRKLAALGGGEESIVAGDLLRPDSLAPALEGVEVAYYLVHSMGGADFEERDRRAAVHFAAAAARAGLRRVVYLGALGDPGDPLSPHLRSRQEVGAILRAGEVPAVELRASVVLGPGSRSFELLAALVERLPVMITPRWVDVPTQPLAADDLVAYLLAAREVELDGSEAIEIGGADRVTFLELMREYARQRGLRRAMIRVPVLTPRLSSLWLSLVTPADARLGRLLIESIRNPTVVRDPAPARRLGVRPRSVREAIALALADRAGQDGRGGDGARAG